MPRIVASLITLPRLTAAAQLVWRSKYAWAGESGPEQTLARVAQGIACVEVEHHRWAREFALLLNDFRFLPGGRILAGAGRKGACLCSCFVSGALDGTLENFELRQSEAKQTMAMGGGVGVDLTPLPPSAKPTTADAPSPLQALRRLEKMCQALTETKGRRGAMMAVLACEHPDIAAFINVKRSPSALPHLNLSVAVSDTFLRQRQSRANAALWRAIAHAAHESAEPGLLFIDRINCANPLPARGDIRAANPCGEAPMPPFGACDLGSINLTRFVQAPFTTNAHVDEGALSTAAAHAVRFLDNVLDISAYPLIEQEEEAKATRRIGLGITGLGDALTMLNHRYDADEARDAASAIMRTICSAAYRASIDLAREKGSFPALVAQNHVRRGFAQSLPADIQHGILKHGLRNASLLSIAPAGSISLFANNVSSGVEPAFAARTTRRLLGEELQLEGYACRLWRQTQDTAAPPAFVDIDKVSPDAQLAMVSALQAHIDGSISKTITASAGFSRVDVERLLDRATNDPYVKGIAFFRRDSARGEVVSTCHSLTG